jgi:hypothetical protein
MESKNLPKTYKGYSVKELLQVLEELKTPKGTKAPKEKIQAMYELVREYHLTPVHQLKGNIDFFV